MKCMTADDDALTTPPTCYSQRIILLCINYCFNIFNFTFVAWGSFQNSLEKLCQLLHLEIL